MGSVVPAILNAGIGIDSSTLAAMLAVNDPRLRGLTPRLALIATADLETELDVVYDFRDQYLAPFLAAHGHTLVVLQPEVRDHNGQTHSNLYDYYYAQGMVPSRQRRSCTDRFKIQTVRRYAQERLGTQAVEMVIGFDCHEGNRAAKLRPTARYAYSCPLIDLGIGRLQAAAILLELGLPVPRRSACYSCPFSLSQDWMELARHWPHHYEACVQMEANVVARRGKEILLGSKPLRDYPQPRVFQMPPEAMRLFALAQSYLGRITPAWPSYALSLAARELYGADWPAAVAQLKLGPQPLDDPWQIYVRIEYCLEARGVIPLQLTRPCGAWELPVPITLPSAGKVGAVL